MILADHFGRGVQVKVALGVTGCIAAYKALEVMRGLQKAGVSVQVILSRSARHFVTPLTFESLSGLKVITDMFAEGINRDIQHIHVAQDIQALAVVPATANIIGKFAHGIADDFLSTLYLSCPAPIILAPAMNVEMWNHAAVKANMQTLKARGHYFIDPEPGILACGMEGEGRLAGVETIVAHILSVLNCGKTMSGLNVVVTAGPTIEDLDPIRFISNRSSGKMGYALAEAAFQKGAQVFLVSGPTNLQPPAGVNPIMIRSAAQMKDAVLALYKEADIVVMAAAVADYRPAGYSKRKIKKGSSDAAIKLEPTEDILALLGRDKGQQVLVGFAAETNDLLENARDKLVRKNLDLIVANDVSDGVFGEDKATVHILRPSAEDVSLCGETKRTIADRILEITVAVRESRISRPLAIPGEE
jgi:phosphopantothenoylcysteine decarboxylase / phosphopantothenate---cysteine ligase